MPIRSCFWPVESLAPNLFTPPSALPFGEEVILGGFRREDPSTTLCSVSIDVSDVLDEFVEFVELSSKLSFDVCECGG